MQMSKKKLGGGPRKDPEVHAYAERIRRMSDKQIWEEGHKAPSLELCEEVVRETKDDVLAVLAPKFDDELMEKIATVLGEYYKFDTNIDFTDAKRAEHDEIYVTSDDRVIAPGKVYRHFKGNYYKVLYLATDTESEKTMVIYQSINPSLADTVFCRPLLMFISEVDHEKYPDVKQRWRFECVEEKELVKNG